jgi:hypothetical protein
VKDLDSYLNDHLAGSVAALELIAHCAYLYKGKPLGGFFTEIEAQIAADQDTLRGLMGRLGIEESKMRQAGAWAGEKLGRAVLAIAGNEADGLGLLLALEGLIMGIAGKGLLWRALAAASLPKLEMFDFEELQRRAAKQIRRAQTEQVRSARRVLVDKSLWPGTAGRAKAPGRSNQAEATITREQKQIEAPTEGLRKVSALELSKSAPKTVLNNQ